MSRGDVLVIQDFSTRVFGLFARLRLPPPFVPSNNWVFDASAFTIKKSTE
jgi:hypothetical protein